MGILGIFVLVLSINREVGGTEWLEIVIERTSCGEGERERES